MDGRDGVTHMIRSVSLPFLFRSIVLGASILPVQPDPDPLTGDSIIRARVVQRD